LPSIEIEFDFSNGQTPRKKEKGRRRRQTEKKKKKAVLDANGAVDFGCSNASVVGEAQGGRHVAGIVKVGRSEQIVRERVCGHSLTVNERDDSTKLSEEDSTGVSSDAT
jgi:hypothetical protein